MTMLLRGADVLTRTLARAGTRYLFSLSGNQVMPIYDAALDARLVAHTAPIAGAKVVALFPPMTGG